MDDLKTPTGPEDGRTPLMAEIDHIMERWMEKQRESSEKEAKQQADRVHFLASYRSLAETVVKPTMDEVVTRLERDGGGAVVCHSEAKHRDRLILWMSLSGRITDKPRQDRNPYLQFDANAGHRRVDVWEGDIWEGRGTSRATAPWALDDITADAVTQRVLEILERAADHGGEFNPPSPNE